MRTLCLIRHAKSSWKDTSLDDFDRPLNPRGKKDAPEMGRRLRRKEFFPDHIISSPSARTVATTSAILNAMDIDEHVSYLDELYHASASQILSAVRVIPSSVKTLFVVGHNPGLTDFANQICDFSVGNLVTCSVFLVRLDIKQWKDLKADRKGKLHFYDFPKNKK